MKQIEIVPGSIALPLPDDLCIATLERRLRVSLPQDYTHFLKCYGGARPVKGTFPADGHEWAIDRFLCILSDYRENPLGCYDIEVTWGQLDDRLGVDPDALGAEMVPIVVLFADDIVCLDYRQSPDRPSVVVWLHEESEYLSPVTRPVAASFTEFLDLVN